MATLKPPTGRPPTTGPPKAPLKADATATIADTAVFQGTYPVTIGAGTIIHPRARFYAYEGPVVIGDGCIISEKAVIGAQPTQSTGSKEIATRLSYFVTVGPSSTIHPGAHIHSSATIEALATIHRYADIGSHSKICSGCEVPANGKVGEWVVVWGSGLGQRRKRAQEAKGPGPAVVVAAQVAQVPVPGPAPKGEVIEDARLMVLQKEREVLARMVVPAGPKKK